MAPLVCLAVYWFGLRALFQQDDFAWLSLHRRVHDFPSLMEALFQPLAQGTIRPWSERLFFLFGWAVAGMESAPLLRAIAFLTQFAALILLSFLTRRLTGSELAGMLASVLWICNSNLYIPMAWTAAYNQIQCSFFLLLAMWFWVKYTDTGETRYFWWQFVVFVFGLGALEIGVVYPVLAALFALCFDRRQYLKRTLPMFAVSAGYAMLHRVLSPPQKTEIYKMYFDASIFESFWKYLRYAFGAERYAGFRKLPQAPFVAVEAIVGATLLAVIVTLLVKRRWMAAFGTGWFLIALAPVIPLRNHVSDYYLTIPLIGLAMVAAYAIALAVESKNRAWIAVALVVTALYAVPSAWQGRGMARQYNRVSHRVRTFVRSVAYADRMHKDKILLIRGMDDEMFWAAWWDNPFQNFGRTDRLFVSADSERVISPFREMGSISRFFLPDREALAGMQNGSVVSYELMADGRLRNVTSVYREILARDPALALPTVIKLGDSLSGAYLGEGWWKAESNFRWTSGRATFRMRGPVTSQGALVITGFCPEQQLANGTLPVVVTADGRELGRGSISTSKFQLRFPMAGLVKKADVNLVMEVGRTITVAGDDRALGIAVNSLEVVD